MEGGGGLPSSATAFPEPMAPEDEEPGAPPSRRSFFILGSAGHFFAAGIAMPLFLLVRFRGSGLFGGQFDIYVFVVVTLIIWFGLVLHLFGCYGLWRNYASKPAFGIFWYGIASTTMFVVSLWATVSYPGIAAYLGYPAYVLLMYLGPLLIGVTFILEGSVYFSNRDLARPEIATETAVLFIIAGLAFCFPPIPSRYASLFLIGSGIIAMAALIMGGLLLFGAPMQVRTGMPQEGDSQGPPDAPPS